MASRAIRQAQREADRIAVARLQTERRLQHHLQDELYRSERARVSQVGGRGFFSRITAGQRIRDRWRALAGAVTRQQVFYDVIESYRLELEDEAKLISRGATTARLRRLADRGWAERPDAADDLDGVERRDTGSKIRPSDRLRMRIGELQAEMRRLADAEDGDNAAGAEFVKLLEEQERDDGRLYSAWYTHLGRPAYFEKVNEDVRAQAEQAASKDVETTEGASHLVDRAISRVERLTKWLKGLTDFFAQNAVIISIPIEAGFTLPSFLVLTPDKPYAAVLGALVFTAALAGAGSTAALMWRRAIRHTLRFDGKDPEQAASMTRSWVRSYAWLTAVALAVGLTLTIGGADLRSKVPAMSDWLTADARLKSERSDITKQEMNAQDEDAQAQVASAKRDYGKRLAVHESQREPMIRFGSQSVHSDFVVALGVYGFLFFLGALKVLLSTDPYFEYHLLAQSIRTARESRLRLAAARDLYANTRKALAERLKQDLTSARSQLWLLAPADSLSLAPRAEDGSPIPPPPADQSEPSPTEAASNDNESSVSDAWISNRLRRFVRTYLALPFTNLNGRYPGSLKKAMTCQ